MNITKLPSGSYRIRQQYKGKTYSVTVPHKPTQKEATIIMADMLQQEQNDKAKALTVESACQEYYKVKANVLSPTTIRAYTAYSHTTSDELKKMSIYDVSSVDIQREVNRLSADKSAKSVRNYASYIISSIKLYRKDFKVNITYPMMIKKKPYIPTEEEIKIILNEAKGTSYEIPLMLACMGLRRSEICAISKDDLEGNVLTIDKAKVKNTDGSWVIRHTTKTAASTRQIVLPDELCEKIQSQSQAFVGFSGRITKWLTKTQDKYGMEHFSLHKLRHYFASKLSEMGIPEADILKLGGWETDNVMKTVYRHSLDKKNETAKKVADNIGSLFS